MFIIKKFIDKYCQNFVPMQQCSILSCFIKFQSNHCEMQDPVKLLRAPLFSIDKLSISVDDQVETQVYCRVVLFLIK